MKTTIICGLGNPGEKFKNTRHNVGFMVIDEFAGKNNFPEFKLNKKFNSLISENILNEEKIILAKPQTFMNESGKSVKKLAEARPLRNLVVVHDDLDLPLGKIKISAGRGSAGHKGVESIIKEIGTKNFVRLRIGIQPKQYHRPVHGTDKFVLQKFGKEEERTKKMILEKTADALDFLLKEGLEKTMNEYNINNGRNTKN